MISTNPPKSGSRTEATVMEKNAEKDKALAREDLADAAHSARENLSEAASGMRESVTDMGHAARDLASAQVDQLTAEVEILKAKMKERVEQKPLNSMLIAAGGGLLLGLMLRK